MSVKQLPKTALTGVAIMAYLMPTDAQRLAVLYGEAPADLHVTLGFLAEPAAEVGMVDRAMLHNYLREQNIRSYFPLTAQVVGRAQFNYANSADDEHPPCSVLLLQGRKLALAHDAITQAVGLAGLHLSTTFPIWTPHITIGYGITLSHLTSNMVGPVVFDRLVISYAGTKVDLLSK